jgi:serine/threonine protein kinase
VASETDQTHLMQVVYAGRWRVDGKLGEGGMGSVLRATDVGSGEVVALKTLGVHLADNPEFLKRFEREADLLSKMSHPALPRFFGVSRHAGMPFFVMQLVEGRPVSELLKQKQPVPKDTAASILRQLGEVLGYLHSRGVVHRDLKPENLILGAEGHLTLVDFGISAETNVTRLTLPGLAVGTPLYMAPEQIVAGQASPASDVYAMGLLAFTLLTGQHPFAKQDRAGMLTRQVNEAPPLATALNPDVPRAVAGVLKRAMEKAPDVRHASAMEFVQALELAWAMERVPQDAFDAAELTEQAFGAGELPPTAISPARAARFTPQGTPVVDPTRETPAPRFQETSESASEFEPTREAPKPGFQPAAESLSDVEPTREAPRAVAEPPGSEQKLPPSVSQEPTDPIREAQGVVDPALIVAGVIFVLLLIALVVITLV